jgi:hypothetical protein
MPWQLKCQAARTSVCRLIYGQSMITEASVAAEKRGEGNLSLHCVNKSYLPISIHKSRYKPLRIVDRFAERSEQRITTLQGSSRRLESGPDPYPRNPRET